MLNLLLHCGAKSVSRETIECCPTPQRTRTWVPIPHHRLLHQVERTIDGYGFHVHQHAHALWGDGKRYFGLMELTNGLRFRRSRANLAANALKTGLSLKAVRT